MRTHLNDHLLHTSCSLIVRVLLRALSEALLLIPIAEVREQIKGQELSFTEIAKTVGERWQVLPPDEKATYENKSQAMKDHFYAQLAEYKKTQEYADYQKYLADFKAKHDPNSTITNPLFDMPYC